MILPGKHLPHALSSVVTDNCENTGGPPCSMPLPHPLPTAMMVPLLEMDSNSNGQKTHSHLVSGTYAVTCQSSLTSCFYSS